MYGTSFSAVMGKHRTVSAVCPLSRGSLGFFGLVFDSFLFISIVESRRTFLVSENYVLLLAFEF